MPTGPGQDWRNCAASTCAPRSSGPATKAIVGPPWRPLVFHCACMVAVRLALLVLLGHRLGVTLGIITVRVLGIWPGIVPR